MKNLILATLAAALAFGSAASATAQTPNEVIESAIDELSVALDGRREELAEQPDELYEIINAILLPRFDRDYAARLVLATHWKTADAGQRERFIDAFYNNMLRRYADGVLEFQEDRIQVLTFRGDLSKSRVQSKTIVRLNDGTKVPVDYGFVNRNDSWRIFDVTVEGVSFVRNFRAELDAEIRATSLDDVIERLESEAADLDSGVETAATGSNE